MKAITGRKAGILYKLFLVALLTSLMAIASVHRQPTFWEDLISRSIVSQTTLPVSFVWRAISALDWTAATLSLSPTTLLYGVPGQILSELSSGDLTLRFRLLSAFWSFMTILILSLFLRRLFGGLTAFSIAFMLFCSPPFLYFSQYVGSVSATFFTSALLFILTLRSTRLGSFGWKHGLTLALCLYIGTLGYALGRIPVMLFLVWIVVTRLRQPKSRWIAANKGVLVMILAAMFITAVQSARDNLHYFTSGNDDQLFSMMFNQERVRYYLDQELNKGSLEQKISLSVMLLKSNAKDLIKTISPLSSPTISQVKWEHLNQVPELPLYNPFLLPFFIVGLVSGGYRAQRSCRKLALLWLLCSLIAVVSTSRVDMIRLSICSIPFSVIAAIGASLLLNPKRCCNKRAQAAFAISVAFLATLYSIYPLG